MQSKKNQVMQLWEKIDQYRQLQRYIKQDKKVYIGIVDYIASYFDFYCACINQNTDQSNDIAKKIKNTILDPSIKQLEIMR